MRSGSWATGPVLTPGARVTVNGTTKAVDAVSVSRELPRVLPGQVASVGGVTAATGDVDWSQAEDVTERVPTPWTRKGYPSRGERVGVWASDGAVEHKVFTGYTDGTTGRFSTSAHSTDLVDDIDKLNTAFSMQALARVMPPRSPAADGRRRMIGLVPQYFTNRVLRAAGFYTTPPMDGYCVASAPLVGSTWPERGTLENSYATNDDFGFNRYNPTFAWSSLWGGLGTANVFASYNIDTSVYSGHITSARPLSITTMVGVTHRNSGYVAAAWGDGTRQIRLAVSSTRNLSVQWRNSAGEVTTWVSMNDSEAPGMRAATAHITVNTGGSSFIVYLRTDTGVMKSATIAVPDNHIIANPVAQMWVWAPDNRLGGAQLSFTSLAWSALGYTQNAWLDAPVSTVNLEAIPAIEAGNCLDLLRAQSEAECAAFWLDEDGVLRWKSRDQFTAGSVVRTLTAADDLLDVAFRMDGQDVRRKITVTYRQAAVATSRSESLVLHEGSKDELRPGDTQEEWIKPGADEDWLQVDTAHDVIVGGGGTGPMNTGMGTFLGFTGIDANSDEVLTNTGYSRTTSFTAVGVNAYLYKLSIESLPTGVERVITRTIDNTALKSQYRDKGLPLVRGMGKITWTDQAYATGAGPAWAPELEHDAAWFVQDPAEVQTLAQWIAAQTNAPHPVIESVEIIPDPRLQLGDKVTIDDPARTGVRITGVIIGITQAISNGDHTMSLKLLVTLVETPHVTLDEFDAWYSGMTLDQLDAQLAGMTLDQLDATPLR